MINILLSDGERICLVEVVLNSDKYYMIIEFDIKDRSLINPKIIFFNSNEKKSLEEFSKKTNEGYCFKDNIYLRKYLRNDGDISLIKECLKNSEIKDNDKYKFLINYVMNYEKLIKNNISSRITLILFIFTVISYSVMSVINQQ